MNCSLERVPFYCAVLLPKRMFVYLYDIFVRSDINKALIPSLTITGVLLAVRVILAMRGISTSTMATRTTTISPITIMFGVLGQESKEYARV